MTNRSRTYQICQRCIMDTSDPDIVFYDDGRCYHCRRYDERARLFLSPESEREAALSRLLSNIKSRGNCKKYDCLIGVSGGVDSTYVALMVKKLGLRPLAVHLDNGWNSELAVANIERTLKALDIDLVTHVLDWEEFRDLQIAFLKASTPDCEIPTDHAIMGLLYQTAAREGIRTIVLGSNVKTEGIMPRAWSDGHGDWKYIRLVHKRFGERQLRTYPHYSLLDFARYKFLHRQKLVSILNYLPYEKSSATSAIENELKWKNYGGKHYESIYTRFYQGYILPKKFGFDKRRAHLSSLICSGQMSRDAALEEMKKEPYPAALQAEDRAFVQKKLGLNESQFAEIMQAPPKRYMDYPSYAKSPLYQALFHAAVLIRNARLRRAS